jgi:hypothetical protein
MTKPKSVRGESRPLATRQAPVQRNKLQAGFVPPSMRRLRTLARAGIGGVGVFFLSATLMHWIQPDLSPVDDAVSYYMNGPFGWILGLGLVSIGLASLAELAAIRQVVGVSSAAKWGSICLVIWGAGCVIGGIFPPDPRGHWGEPPSIAGLIHANVAIAAFLAFPAGSILLSGPLQESTRTRHLRPLAYVSAISLAAFIVSLAPVFSHHAPRWLGLSERVVLIAYLSWLVAAASAILKGAAQRRGSHAGTLSG